MQINPAILNSPFVSVALPLIVTILIAMWGMVHSNNKGFDGMRIAMDGINRRLDDTNRRLDGVDRRLDNIDRTLKEHGERLAKFEGPSPLVHR